MKIWAVMLACALMLSGVSSVPLLLQNPKRVESQRLDLLRKANQNLPDARTIKHPQPRSHSGQDKLLDSYY